LDEELQNHRRRPGAWIDGWHRNRPWISRTKEKAADLRNAIVDLAFHKGLLVLGAGENTIRLSPPLLIDQEQADFAVRTLEGLLPRGGKESLIRDESTGQDSDNSRRKPSGPVAAAEEAWRPRLFCFILPGYRERQNRIHARLFKPDVSSGALGSTAGPA